LLQLHSPRLAKGSPIQRTTSESREVLKAIIIQKLKGLRTNMMYQSTKARAIAM